MNGRQTAEGREKAKQTRQRRTAALYNLIGDIVDWTLPAPSEPHIVKPVLAERAEEKKFILRRDLKRQADAGDKDAQAIMKLLDRPGLVKRAILNPGRWVIVKNQAAARGIRLETTPGFGVRHANYDGTRATQKHERATARGILDNHVIRHDVAPTRVQDPDLVFVLTQVVRLLTAYLEDPESTETVQQTRLLTGRKS